MAPPEDDVNEASDVDADAESLQKMTEMKASRASAKGNMSRIKTLITKKGANLSTDDLQCRLEILEQYFKQCLRVQANIERVCTDTASNIAAITEVEDIYVATKTKIMSILTKRRVPVADVSVLNTSTLTAGPRLRREVKLPTFSGKYSEFPKFNSLFNKIIHQDELLDNCERFLILKEHLGPRPLAAIADFDVTDDNYPKALERLTECFDKKALMFEEHVTALFAIPKVAKSSAAHLRQVLDGVNAHLSAMLSLGDHKDVANAILIHMVMERVDEDSQVKWEEAVDYTKLSSWDECSAVLMKRCQNLEARESKLCPVDAKPTNNQRDYKNKRFNKTSLSVTTSACTFCQGSGHELSDCTKFKNLAIRDRRNAARRAKVCFRCLKGGHLYSGCSAAKCPKCNQPHHMLLHKDYAQEATVQSHNELPSTSAQAASKSSVMNLSAEPEVFLATAIVLVKDSCGNFHRARAVLDSASQVNLMCENLAQKLLLKKKSCKLDASGVGGVETIIKKQTVATIGSRLNNYEVSLEFYVLPKITSPKPDQYFDVSGWQLPKNIPQADPVFNKPAKVDILIGAEVFFDLLSVGRIHLDDSLPRLQKTVLGWIIAGKAKDCVAPCQNMSNLLIHSELNEDKLNMVMEKFWEMEQISNKSKFLTKEEEECERIFIETIRRDSSGRFITTIPFKSSVKELGGSHNAAARRLLSLERRLSRDSVTREAYNAFMNEYLSLGHMTVVEDADMGKIKYFTPHQHVLRPESTSTKLRVVFDCSCKTDSGISLNDVMMKGPQVQDDLLSIILRFRCYKYAITADVTKMYRQAWVTDNDANYQAILWRSSPEEQLKAYRLRTITYGTTSAPYLATRCLKKLGEDYAAEYPIGSKKILSDFYMDDLISGSNDENEIFEIYKQVSTVLDTAKFTLRKWFSNSENFLNFVPDADKEKTLRLNDEEIIKTLGITWAPVGDTFRYFWPCLDNNKAITKRIVLSELSKLFDPLGLINPLIVKAKIFMQDLWILKLSWDESLPMNLHCLWSEFRRNLKDVKNISVPRFVLAKKKIVRVEMHGFADASKRAYGCCIYIRTICDDDDVTAHLWSAKSRVAPVKTQSLPRLELLGAELLSKLVTKTKANFPIKIDSTYLWTDSEIVLDWLSEHPSNWNTFVANRVSSIQEQTKDCIWRHVPSKFNAADIISRGAYANELLESFWFSGPSFLKKSCDEWPANRSRKKRADIEEERSTSSTILLINPNTNNFPHEKSKEDADTKPSLIMLMETYSDWEKLQKVFVCLLSFRNRTKGMSEQLDEALIRMIYCLQQYYFREEISMLLKNRQLPATSKYKSLSLFIEYQYGIPLLRVGGRLLNADLPYDAKHQILLPNNSQIVKIYIRFLHIKYLHAGTQALMAIIRQRFWVFHARSVIRAVTGTCLQCFRCRPRLSSQIMGDLPHSRVAVAKPFTVTGVDFCGPITTTYRLRGCRTTKSYIAVFICFSTKAIHMEVVSDLTAKAFLAALKRFVARRGLCTQLFCDNATNFVGTRRELEDMKKKFFDEQVQGKITKYCAANSIQFCHIPPRSPHFGGLWEAAVKSAKYHLARILGQSHLTFEELTTVVTEVEAVLNSRPLTAMSNDPNDEGVLTPAHFLTGGPIVGVAEPTIDSKDWSHLDRWLMISAIQQHFWKRWSIEYLHELQQKVKWTKKQKNLNEGDLVLVAEDNLPPKQWLIGRVLRVVRDPQGTVRVADVKTKNGEFRRAIHKLAPIPYDG